MEGTFGKPYFRYVHRNMLFQPFRKVFMSKSTMAERNSEIFKKHALLGHNTPH